MTNEKLQKANELKRQIDFIKKNIESCEKTQYPETRTYGGTIHFNCSSLKIDVPESLYRIVGKIILSEEIVRLEKLQKEFDSL